jgi:hypothetical protein
MTNVRSAWSSARSDRYGQVDNAHWSRELGQLEVEFAEDRLGIATIECD